MFLALAATLVALASPLQGSVVEDSFASAAGRLSFDVYLPPGYVGPSTRYPVVYYLHGLPAGPRAFTSFTYVPQALEAAGRRAIVVAPQGAKDSDRDPEYLDWQEGRKWETSIGVQLPRVVDARYRTIARRSARVLVGVSAGGYGAMILGLHQLGTFGAVESWSGYFRPTDPTGTRTIAREPSATVESLVGALPHALARDPTFIGFYVGASDRRFRADNVNLARALSRAHVPFAFRIYPGGHTQTLWSTQAPTWLGLALDRLDPAR